ncbi:NifB/NifX family molybdenum-iron cluster-binding protein [Thermodesulfatator atlanticus]|uniref:NifB/NifX family molybdenum-iron cluster-binding protein n=1 Tax=Thermodesulfatator atlanticus TaxID=501497 RepID=UPI0003B5833B|nr:NifB/NifX family molybdenum-iron cluster-binding protein [Thermodesulfatator atlanticus]
MKIAITAQGNDLSAPFDPRFGRAQYFIIYDTETDSFEAIANEAVNAPQGAGIAAANYLAEKGISLLITGNCGPKAFAVLSAAGIKVAQVDVATVEDALKAFKAGRLAEIEAPTVEAHFGVGVMEASAPEDFRTGKGQGGGRSMGVGRGLGGGRGFGGGRGCGQGGGRGRGCGRGQGGGRGRGRGRGCQ